MIKPSKSHAWFFTMLLLSCSTNIVTAQMQEPQIIPASPGAAALAKFVDVPVGVYTGVPNISVPLHTIDLKKTKLDISISYHALGNKVNSESSNVGLSWALDAGGVITHEIRGRFDEGGSRTTSDPELFRDQSQILDWFDNVIDRYEYEDPEPDIFTYNFGAYKGKFIFDYAGNIQTLEKSEVKIYKRPSGPSIFDIVTPDGLTYSFAENNYYESGPSSHRTAYFPTSIKDHLSNELARFVYERELFVHFNLEGDFAKYLISGPGYLTLFESSLAYQKYLSAIGLDTWRVKTITFPEGNVVFNYKNTNREDIHSSGTAKAIESIVVNNHNKEIKKVVFSTSYFLTPGLDAVVDNLKHNYKRLRLDKVSVSSPDNSINESYSFKYNQEPLPPKRSFCQDLWGFYNGKTSNGQYKNQALGHMIPSITNENTSTEYLVINEATNQIEYRTPINFNINLTLADRNPDNHYTQACILEQINLPTEGYKKFQYELNTYYDQKTNSNVTASGLRIKNQIFNDGGKDETWSYLYTQPYVGTSSGYLDSKPQFFYIEFNRESENSWHPQLRVNSYTTTEVRTSGGGIVVYSDVEVKQIYTSNGTTVNNGSTLYSFYTSQDSELQDQENYVTFGLKGTSFPPDHPRYPGMIGFDNVGEMYDRLGHYLPSPSLLYLGEGVRGKTRSIKYFSSSSPLHPVKEEEYRYSEWFMNDVIAAKVSNFDGMYLMRKYRIRPSLSRLDSKTVIENGVISTTDYSYPDAFVSNPHFLPVSELKPDNKTIKYKYTYDFHQNTIANNLAAKNVYVPIFTEVWKNGKLISLTYNEYGANLLPSKIHALSSKTPLTASPVTYTTGNFTIDQSLIKPEIVFDTYDPKGNILELHKNNNVSTSYIWGYNQCYPIIMSQNINNATLEAAYRSALSAAGISDFGELTTPSLSDAQKTKLKNFHNALLGNTNLAKARTTIFTYLPLIGMTSQTDPNGITTYYEYDTFGRLNLIKDKDNNILKSYDYNYKVSSN